VHGTNTCFRQIRCRTVIFKFSFFQRPTSVIWRVFSDCICIRGYRIRTDMTLGQKQCLRYSLFAKHTCWSKHKSHAEKTHDWQSVMSCDSFSYRYSRPGPRSQTQIKRIRGASAKFWAKCRRPSGIFNEWPSWQRLSSLSLSACSTSDFIGSLSTRLVDLHIRVTVGPSDLILSLSYGAPV
jgi:hypothetical protein